MSLRTRAIALVCAGCVAVGGYVLDARSIEVLKPVDAGLAEVAYCASKDVPIKVYHGMRTDAEQAGFIAKGVSLVRRSKHQDGLAIDVMTKYASGKWTWENKYYPKVAAAFYACSRKLGIPIIWGGEWKRFKDMVHFERKTK